MARHHNEDSYDPVNADSQIHMTQDDWSDIMRQYGDEDRGRMRCRDRSHLAARCERYGVVALFLLAVSLAAFELTGRRRRGDGYHPPFRTASDLSWEDVCSDESVSTVLGRDDCERRCAELDCCAIDHEEGESCVDSRSEECARYHDLCPKLAAGVDAWEEACSDELLNTRSGYDACRETCGDYECCMDDDLGCDEVHSNVCDIYWNLCPKMADISFGFDQEDKDESEIVTEEEEIHGDHLDLVDGEVTLDDLDEVEKVEKICSGDSVANDQEALEECLEICNSRRCCFDAIESVNCFEERQEWCDLFHDCLNAFEKADKKRDDPP